jgi:hypothetical protein
MRSEDSCEIGDRRSEPAVRPAVPRRRVAALALIALVTGTTLTGCTTLRTADPDPSTRTASPVDADSAEEQVIAAVQDVTDSLGGEWETATGPDYAERCTLPDGDEGASWRYLVRRASSGEPRADADTVADLWRDRGMSVERRGTEDRPTVVGSGGGSVSAVGLYVSDVGYSVQAVSLCFPGDADEL